MKKSRKIVIFLMAYIPFCIYIFKLFTEIRGFKALGSELYLVKIWTLTIAYLLFNKTRYRK